MQSALTIIIPTYNRSSLLDRTLSSLTQQTYTDFQVILVDHGSTDNTKDVFSKYSTTLNIEYYWILRDSFSPGIPRDLGVSKTRTSLLAFLDTGVVVPSFYVDAHCRFHQQYNDRIGVGPLLGRQEFNWEDNNPFSILEQKNIDEVGTLFMHDPRLRDIRSGMDLMTLEFSWFFAWTANLSMTVDAYKSVGGFDRELKGWGFEDLDLAYRLYKKGYQLQIVEDGWGIDLPHERIPWEERRKTNQENIERSYRKHQSLALECGLYAHDFIKAKDAFQYLTMLGRKYQELPALPDMSISRPSLLIGGTQQEAARFDYIALADENITPTSSLWSCSGVCIPLADQSLQSVVISDIWKWLGCSFSARNLLFIECLIAEIKRTARHAFFLHTPVISGPEDHCNTSLDELVALCRSYDLPYTIVTNFTAS